MIRYRLDNGHGTVLGVCGEPGCGFRALANDRSEAVKQRRHHEVLCHMTRGPLLATRRQHRRNPAECRISGGLKA